MYNIPVTAFVSWEILQPNAAAMSAWDNVVSKYLCSSFVYVATASTLVAEFLSTLASAVEFGFGRTLLFVKFIISSHPCAVICSGCGGGCAVSGQTEVPGTTSCIIGRADALRTMVYWLGVNAVAS